jgi:hypothetical protein
MVIPQTKKCFRPKSFKLLSNKLTVYFNRQSHVVATSTLECMLKSSLRVLILRLN